MHINFVTLANESIASYRYHAMIPSRQLEQYGHSTSITEHPDIDADIVVFSKHWNYGDYWYLRGVQAEGKQAVMHVCDDHFNTKHREHYIRMINAANIVLASTSIMAERVKEHTGRKDVKVVFDSIEMPRRPAKFAPNEKLKVFWQGHHSNLDGLMDIMPLGDEYELRICTTPGIQLPKEFNGIAARPWTPQAVSEAFTWCDVVIVPVRYEVQKLSKSHNRVTEAVQAGRFVIASDLNSYEPYRDTMYLGDIRKGLEFLLIAADPILIQEQIQEAQEIAKRNYAPQVIGHAWEGALNG